MGQSHLWPSPPRRVTNVRDDKVLTSNFWKPSFEARRCIVPASSYCEPNGQSPATWYWFALNGEHERPLFAFPGIWQRWMGPVKKDGPNVEIDTYAFMTTEPNALRARSITSGCRFFCRARISLRRGFPVPVEEAFVLARSFDPGAMRIVQSGKEKEDMLGRRLLHRTPSLL